MSYPTDDKNEKDVNNVVEAFPAGENELPGSADAREGNEVFKVDGEMNYRTVGWKKAAMIFVKMQFALGVLSIPSDLNVLGAVGGSILVVTWGILATYGASIMGNFRLNHQNIHSVGDAGTLIGGKILGEIVGAAYFISWVLPAGVSMLGISIALNAVSEHATCTVVFTTVAMIACAVPAALPRFSQIGVLTWIGFASMLTAVFIVVVAVTQVSRPAAAPPGDYELGFKAIAFPNFMDRITASNTILGSYGGSPAFLSAAAEMRNPTHFKKALVSSMGFTIASYLAFSLVVYAYCGQYVASPALGSPGPLIKKIAYGIALPGLMVSCILFIHISAKHILVRILRDTEHLQKKTKVHHAVWYGSVISISVVAYVLAEGIPFFNSLLGLLVLFVSPNTLSLPMAMWFYDNRKFGRKTSIWAKAFHGLILVVGLFVGVAGAVGAILQINQSFQNGTQGVAFSCADNSGST